MEWTTTHHFQVVQVSNLTWWLLRIFLILVGSFIARMDFLLGWIAKKLFVPWNLWRKASQFMGCLSKPLIFTIAFVTAIYRSVFPTLKLTSSWWQLPQSSSVCGISTFIPRRFLRMAHKTVMQLALPKPQLSLAKLQNRKNLGSLWNGGCLRTPKWVFRSASLSTMGRLICGTLLIWKLLS